MKQKRVVMIGLVTLICLGLVSLWTETDSQCAALTQAQRGDHTFPVCLEAARKGNAYAQNIVGISYATGDGIDQDSAESLKWLRKSARQNFAKAQSNLGIAFLISDGVDQDYTQAVKWWQLAAEQDEPHAKYNLAVSYQCGCGIEQNNVLATKWYLLASLSYLRHGMFRTSLKSMARIR